MKNILLSFATASMLAFTGCANSGLGMNGISQSDVKKTFQNGTITNIKKVLVGKSKLTTLSYSGLGAVGGGVAGAVIGDSTPAVVGGAVIGAGIGAITSMFQEVEAYQVEIKDNATVSIYIAFIEKQLPKNTNLEFVVRENGEVTNISINSIENL